ncbi:MAG: hypothetical protein GX418_06510 [Clostridiales bacterium]|nr:hypothetical protein [Clostridiales bacterium]
MKRIRAALPPNVPEPPWQGRAHRVWFWLLTGCLALYLSFAAYLGGSGLFLSGAETAAALLWFLLLALSLFAALVRFSQAGKARAAAGERGRLNPRLWLAGTAVAFGILSAYLAASYPGGVSVDSAVQWTQAATGRYSNWHPVFHTLLLRLGWLIRPNYAFVVALQCGAFSVAVGYLAATLAAWGVRPWALLVAEALAVASPIVGHTMMYLWKDNAMTVGVVWLTAQAVNLFFSRGAWLGRTRNALAFGLALAFTTLVRHNALLFTLPLGLIAAVVCRERVLGVLTAAATLLVAVWLVWGPLYAALGVTYPSNTLEESVGLPMTVVSDIRKVNPDALDAETRAFTDRMAGEAGWEAYRLHEYNSIKFGATREAMAGATLAQVLRMAASAAQADPRDAFRAVAGTTELVWGLGDLGAANVTVRNSGDLPGVPRQAGTLNRLGSAVKAFLAAPSAVWPVSWYFGNLGVSFAAMLLLSLRALRRNGPRALMLCVPTLCYNLGTMLVLCGNDARFFSFSPLVCTLSLFALVRDVPAAPDSLGKQGAV